LRAEYDRLYHGKTHIDWPSQGIRIGPLGLLAITGEPFTEINQAIVSSLPFAHTLFPEFSHGGFGYTPAQSAYAEGGYEVEASPFSAEASHVIVKENLSVPKELARDQC